MSPLNRLRAGLPRGFGTIWLSVAVDLVGFGIVLPILPIYAKTFHASSLQAALLVAAFSATSFVFSPLWGRFSDRFGRRPALIVSLLGTAVGSLVTGLAGGLPLLFVGRIVDGASGASISVAQAAAADLAAPEDRPRLFGLLGAAFGVGFVAGPAIGALAALAGPRLPFFVAAGLATLNTVLAWRRLPETRPARGARVAQTGSPPQAAAASPAIAAPVRRVIAVLVGVAFSAVAGFSAFEATFALFGQLRLGLGIASAAGVFAAAGVVIVVVQGVLVHPAVSKLGERGTLLSGLGGNTAGFLMLARAHSWALAAPALLLLTAGQGLIQTTMATVLAGLAPPDRRGEVLGFQQSASALGRVAGPVMGGALLGASASGAPYVASALLTVAAASVLLVGTASGVGGRRTVDRGLG